MKKFYNYLLLLLSSNFLIAAEDSSIKKLNVGLVGMGQHMSEKIIPSLKSKSLRDKFHLYFAVRNNQSALSKQQELFEIEKIGSSYEELIEDPNVDIIIVAGDPSLHIKVIEAAIRKKIPVFCEKPLSFSLLEAKKLSLLASGSPEIPKSVGFNFLFMPKLVKFNKNHSLKELNMNCSMGKYFNNPENFEDAFNNALYFAMIHPLSLLVDAVGLPDVDNIDINIVVDEKTFGFKLRLKVVCDGKVSVINFETNTPKGFTFNIDLVNEKDEMIQIDVKEGSVNQKQLSYSYEFDELYENIIEGKQGKNNLEFNLKVQILADIISKKVIRMTS